MNSRGVVSFQISKSELISVYGNFSSCLNHLGAISPLGRYSKVKWTLIKFFYFYIHPIFKFRNTLPIDLTKLNEIKGPFPFNYARCIINYANINNSFFIIFPVVDSHPPVIWRYSSGEGLTCNNINELISSYSMPESLIPKVISSTNLESCIVTVSEFIIGTRVVTSVLSDSHFAALRSLNETGEFLEDSISDVVASYLTKLEDCALPKCNFIYNKMVLLSNKLNTVKLEKCITHGDFAPYNIIFRENGLITLIDWEFANTNMLPLYDLVYYHLSVNALFLKQSFEIICLNLLNDAVTFFGKGKYSRDLISLFIVCNLIDIFYIRKEKYPGDEITVQVEDLLKWIEKFEALL